MVILALVCFCTGFLAGFILGWMQNAGYRRELKRRRQELEQRHQSLSLRMQEFLSRVDG
jgi:hypothetical protein